jgi:hypothetical protein
MNYDELFDEAIKKDELDKLLCGIKPYEVEVSKFASDVFPTDVNAVLVNCIYKKKMSIQNIDFLFMQCLKKMIKDDACQLYIAILYFDACIFQEERGKATFKIGKEMLAENIKEAVGDKKSELESTIVFDNGLRKNNPLKNIVNFNKYYKSKYGFSIV